MTGTPLWQGTGSGPLLILQKPVSFWGGVDPRTGVLSDPRHPQHGEPLAGRILVMDRTIGSSSSSAVMLELLRGGIAPAGLVISHSDAILIVGILVAQELGYPTIPVLLLDEAATARLADTDGMPATMSPPTLSLHARGLIR